MFLGSPIAAYPSAGAFDEMGSIAVYATAQTADAAGVARCSVRSSRLFRRGSMLSPWYIPAVKFTAV
jgi:hypothetical protein